MRRIETRRWNRVAGAALAAAWLGTAGAGAETIEPDAAQAGARAAVNETVDNVLAVLRDESLSRPTRLERVEQLAYGRFDFDTISKLVLARNWNKLTPEQRADFVAQFKRHLSLTYGDNLEEYSDENVEVGSTRVEGNGDVTVRTRLVGGGRPEPVLIDYRLRPKQGEWRVIDVIIEGVSMIANFRSQTQEIITEKGADGLIDALRAKNAKREAEQS